MSNLYLIVSEDEKLIDFYLQDILKNINYEDDNKIIYNLKDDKFSDILDEASMISLFSNIKVIIGNNFDISKLSSDELEYLENYTNNYNKDVYIILIASKVDARVKAYKIFKDSFKIINTVDNNLDDDIFKFVKDKIKDNNYKMDDYNIEYFISRAGKDINNLNSELEKLFIYKEEDKTILREDIDLLVMDTIDNVIYEFTNAVIEKDMDNVVKMYHNFKIENVGIDYLLVSLANVFRQALIIKCLSNRYKSNSEIAKVIGKKEFYVKKMLERLYSYTEDDICKIINRLFEIDYNNKMGKSNYDELELFLLDMNK